MIFYLLILLIMFSCSEKRVTNDSNIVNETICDLDFIGNIENKLEVDSINIRYYVEWPNQSYYYKYYNDTIYLFDIKKRAKKIFVDKDTLEIFKNYIDDFYLSKRSNIIMSVKKESYPITDYSYIQVVGLYKGCEIINHSNTLYPNIVFNSEFIDFCSFLEDLGDNQLIYEKGDRFPEYVGGNSNLDEWINENIIYPEELKELRIEDKVVLRFVVEKNGEIGKIELLKPSNPLFNSEAIRLIQNLSTFNPGSIDGNHVAMWYTIVIDFNLK